MHQGILLSKRAARRVIAGLATIGAIALTVEGTIGERPPQIDLRGALPQNLRPDEAVVGRPWVGQAGVTVTVDELESRSAREPKHAVGEVIERRHEQAGTSLRGARRDNPASPRVAEWPLRDPSSATARDEGPLTSAFNSTLAFDGPNSTESPYTPPDTNGAVGPNQIMMPANGRIKIFSKTGTLVASFTDSSLWTSVTSSGVSDPHVRYDRTSGRWFITEIDVAATSNKILVAVSSGSDISSASSFTVYGFAHDAPGGGGIDAGHFADYDTLGVDANALYIGINEFTSSTGTFQNTSGYVVRKSSLIGGGPIVVTAFRGLAVGSGAGAWTPQGVQHDDPSATEGYFIGVDNVTTGQLDIYRVGTPGGTPTISGAMNLTVPSTYYPQSQNASGSLLPIDTLDDRLFAAEIRTNRYTGVQTLWTAHNILVNPSGVGSPPPSGSGTGDRNASRWYQIGNMTSTPTLVQSGTVFDSGSASNPYGYIIPSVVANGEGHAVFGATTTNPTATAPSAMYASRLSSDTAGSFPSQSVNAIGTTYNLQKSATCGCSVQRWGDYSQTVVDPNDDMTIWTFQEYASATDTYAVRAIRLTPPGPATPASVSPTTVPRTSSTPITITGTSSAGSAFFDPGTGFANRLVVSFSGGVLVNSFTVVDATHIQVNINTSAATPGSINVAVANPDGQNIGTSSLFTVTGGLVGGDFDGDAKSDMTIYQPDGTWKILKSTSGYTAATTVGWGGAGYVAVPGDYDGDGKIDPAVYNTATGQWSALKSSTNYTTTFSQSWGGTGYAPEPGDYDGDGKIDPAVYNTATGQWSILKSSSGYTTTISVSWGGTGYTPVPGKDFDGDGKADIAIYRESAGTWSILKSSTAYATTLTITWGGLGYTLVPGDYDGDGKADAGLYEPSTGNWYVLLSGTGYTTTLNKSWGGVGYDPVPGDYDGDGKYDLAIVQRSTGNWSILKSSTAFTTTISVSGWGASSDTLVSSAIVPGGSSDTRRAGDFDGDGKTDLSLYVQSTGNWYTLTSGSGYTASASRSWGGSTYGVATGDYDGDGRTDYGLYQASSGNWLILLSGSGFTTTLSKSAGGTGWTNVQADYDGDGKTDIAVYNTTTGQWFILKSSSGFTTTMSISYGGTGYTAVPGDFDGDGKADIGVYNTSTGLWSVLLSSTSFTTALSKSVGGAGYVPVQADYDGDGKTDFVVYNTSTGLWYGLKSSTGYTTTLSVSWGGTGYTPIRADFDGDGKADLAIYQASSGNWYALLSSTSYTTSLSKSWGGAGYSPIPVYP
jgi:hypothetical protein